MPVIILHYIILYYIILYYTILYRYYTILYILPVAAAQGGQGGPLAPPKFNMGGPCPPKNSNLGTLAMYIARYIATGLRTRARALYILL